MNFRYQKIPLHISPFFWILSALIGWMNSNDIINTFIWMGVIFLSILIHEYGHALTALAFRQKVSIELTGLGGVTKHIGPSTSFFQEFLITLNGPLAGFLLFIVALFAYSSFSKENTILMYALKVMVSVNLFWTIFNLFPILPLDGGQLVRIILEKIFGKKGVKAFLLFSFALGGLLALIAFLFQHLFLGILLSILSFESYQAWDNLKTSFISNHQAIFEHVNAPLNFQIITATAKNLLEKGELQEAYDMLFSIKDQLSLMHLQLLQHLAYRLRKWKETSEIGTKIYNQKPLLETALLNAFSYAHMQQISASIGWLEAALHLGANMQDILQKPELDLIRYTSEFQKWQKIVKKAVL